MSNIIAITDRLLLRVIEDGDQDLIFQLSRESLLLSNLPQDEECMALYRKVGWEEVNTPEIFTVMLFLKETNEFVGKVCMQFTDKPTPEIGIDILEAHQNKGYGPESIVAFCNWYSAEHNLSEVKVRISKENGHSTHVFEKLGAEYITDASYFPENVIDMMKQMLPNVDMSEFLDNSVKEYLLHLPIKREK